jgi:hypothetical protein
MAITHGKPSNVSSKLLLLIMEKKDQSLLLRAIFTFSIFSTFTGFFDWKAKKE